MVDVQPFGGEGLSGTGPKAGGRLYQLRLLAQRPADAALRAVQTSGPQGAPALRGWAAANAVAEPALAQQAQQALQQWAQAQRLAVLRQLAEQPGPIIGLTTLAPGDDQVPLERLVIERSLSINTAAAGGNASLMSIG